jgi:hypothetical protein
MTTNDLVSISTSDLDNVTGGGAVGTAVKGAKLVGKYGKKAWDAVTTGANYVNAAQTVYDAGKSAWNWATGHGGEKKQ